MSKNNHFKDEEGTISELGNWNVASDYARFMIMRNIYLIDEYLKIAIYGVAGFNEEITTPIYAKDELRIKGLHRLVTTMILTIDNTVFAMKEGLNGKMLEFRVKLIQIRKIIPTLYKLTTDHITKERKVKIYEDKFGKIIDMIQDINQKFKIPLNKSDLIFTSKTDFDPTEYKRTVFDNATNRG